MSLQIEQDQPYPLGIHAPEALRAASGRTLREVTLNAAMAGELSAADLSVSADTLIAQAAIAERHGFPQLAANLRRAAELTRVPNEELLAMYEQLRPRRATHSELLAMAERLDRDYGAGNTAEFVREAAEVYRARGLLRDSTRAAGSTPGSR